MPFYLSRLWILSVLVACGVSCALVATRPVQEMSDAVAAIRAAREVQADVLSPDNFRQAMDLFEQAKREYRFKDFAMAKEHADDSRVLAEKAEVDALLNGGARASSDDNIPDPLSGGFQSVKSPSSSSSKPSAEPYIYPTPTPVPAEEMVQRQLQEQNTPNRVK